QLAPDSVHAPPQAHPPIAASLSPPPTVPAGGPGMRAAPEFKRGDRAWFGAAIAELPDLTSIQMTARADEADRGRVQTGSGVRVRVDAVPDRELNGTLSDISVVAKPDFTTWPPVRNFDVVVAIPDVDPRLRSGMSASARVELDRLADVVVVPIGAVFQRGPATVVFIVARGGIETRTVNVLRRGRDPLAIPAGGHRRRGESRRRRRRVRCCRTGIQPRTGAVRSAACRAGDRQGRCAGGGAAERR